MGGPDLDMEIPSFDVAVLTECFAKRSQWLWAGDKKESDLPYPLRLLRPRRERPRRRAAEQRDELATPHAYSPQERIGPYHAVVGKPDCASQQI
jgi:hypothetical protein